MTESEHTIDDLDAVDTTVGIVDGRVAMSADGDAQLRVESPEHRPLSRIERHATLRVSGTDYRAKLELNAHQLDCLFGELAELETTPDSGLSVSATDAFAFNCRDCGFVGTWLTTDGCCPECGGRDVPTEPRGDGDD